MNPALWGKIVEQFSDQADGTMQQYLSDWAKRLGTPQMEIDRDCDAICVSLPPSFYHAYLCRINRYTKKSVTQSKPRRLSGSAILIAFQDKLFHIDGRRRMNVWAIGKKNKPAILIWAREK